MASEWVRSVSGCVQRVGVVSEWVWPESGCGQRVSGQ